MIFVKKLTIEDRPLVSKWFDADPVHSKSNLSVDDIFEDGTEAALISDEDGVPVLAIRLHKALRIGIQFNPETPYKTAKVAKEVVEWFKVLAKEAGCKEVIIRPGGKAVRFSEKLGFLPFIGKYLKA